MFFLGWPLLSVLANSGRASRWLEMGVSGPEILGEMALWAALGMALSALIWFPWRRWMAEANMNAWRLLALVVICALSGVALEAVMRAVDWPSALIGPPPGRPERSAWTHAFAPGVAMFSWVLVHYLMDTFERLGVERERALRAESLATEAQLTMLRNELNPHFLFNALNSIIGVISEDPKKAQSMVRQLAGLLRHTLRGPSVSTLGAEVEVAMKYLRIEQLRFEERLEVEVALPEELSACPLPPMLLQPLVENAIKHGPNQGTMRLHLQAEVKDSALHIQIRNTGQLKKGQLKEGQLKESQAGVGLRNLRERLSIHSAGGHFELFQQGPEVVALLTLPMDTP